MGRVVQYESLSTVLPTMSYLAVLSFILPFLFHLTISGAQPRSDGRFHGGFKGEEPMNHPHPRRFGEGPKSEFFRICSPWHPFGRWWLPDFLKNVSSDGMNSFCDIVRNENLTKAETEQQLDHSRKLHVMTLFPVELLILPLQEKFKNYMDQKKQMRVNVQQKIQELIANVSKFIDDQEKILSDTSLTSGQEKEQLMHLTMETDWVVVRIAHMIRKEADFLAGEHRRGPCPGCGPRFPHMRRPFPPMRRPFPPMPRPFPQHGFDFDPDMPGRGSQFPGNDDEPFGYGPFDQEELFEQNELPGRNGPPVRNGPWAA
uniref:ANIS5_cation-bd domain-containing protein n=1 Tax=Ascaris lumbricoides TaxID=6252 RepID=A0A0M3IAP1_ASCLU